MQIYDNKGQIKLIVKKGKQWTFCIFKMELFIVTCVTAVQCPQGFNADLGTESQLCCSNVKKMHTSKLMHLKIFELCFIFSPNVQ